MALVDRQYPVKIGPLSTGMRSNIIFPTNVQDTGSRFTQSFLFRLPGNPVRHFWLLEVLRYDRQSITQDETNEELDRIRTLILWPQGTTLKLSLDGSPLSEYSAPRGGTFDTRAQTVNENVVSIRTLLTVNLTPNPRADLFTLVPPVSRFNALPVINSSPPETFGDVAISVADVSVARVEIPDDLHRGPDIDTDAGNINVDEVEVRAGATRDINTSSNLEFANTVYLEPERSTVLVRGTMNRLPNFEVQNLDGSWLVDGERYELSDYVENGLYTADIELVREVPFGVS